MAKSKRVQPATSGKPQETANDPDKLVEKVLPPMLATLVSGLPRSDQGWWYELKYDGFRAVAALAEGRVALRSRNALDLGPRFPIVVAALSKMKLAGAVLDGEIVVLDESGAPRFQLLQRSDNATIFFVFDLLRFDGKDLRDRPIEERRALLEKALARLPRDGAIRLAEMITDPAKIALETAARRGFEGLIAKARGSIYENRRSKLWLKIKAINAQELAVIGFTSSNHSSQEIGALLLGVMDQGEMTFAGKVGTGFSAKQRVDLKRALSGNVLPKAPAANAPRMREATWVKPTLVAQVRFTEWTSDGKLRHPSFLGLRPDKSPKDCVREKPAAATPDVQAKSTPKVDSRAKPVADGIKPKSRGRVAIPVSRSAKAREGRDAVEVNLSSPDRLLYPRDGITKRDVADYFQAVSEAMIRALDGRPLALEHWNDGIDKGSWYQQNIGNEAKQWMTLADTPTRTSKRTVRHLVADRPETLRWLAQHSVLTVHMWSSRMSNLESPDWVIFDLDPAKGQGIEQAVEAALVLRQLFEKMKLPSVPKTSGKRGIHLLVPLLPGHSHEDGVDFACRIADAVASKIPSMTTERPLAARRGRLYLDCLQNGYGKTIVAPYSLRAIDGAPVSAPLEWGEVTPKLDPLRFNLRTMPDRLAKKGDLFRAAVEGGVKLPQLR